MTRQLKYRSSVAEAVHHSARDLFEVGAIDKTTMRDFDRRCLIEPAAVGADAIRQIRDQAQMSQPVFAHYLNTSPSTVQKWESGAKKPSGPALKLLSLVQKHGIDILK